MVEELLSIDPAVALIFMVLVIVGVAFLWVLLWWIPRWQLRKFYYTTR